MARERRDLGRSEAGILTLQGYVAVTHYDWFQHLERKRSWDEVNFWRPSARPGFNGVPGTPFFFKLKAPHNAIGGFGLVARFSRLPEWLAWDCFGEANGAPSFDAMESRLQEIRARNRFKQTGKVPQIGCILLSDAVFFPSDLWIPQPADWSSNNLTSKLYDLSHGEGLRIWQTCLQHATALGNLQHLAGGVATPGLARYGKRQLVAPRLGQGTFRVVVTDAYDRACAVTGEHSLPALEAAHIKPYSQSGPHEIPNGLLLRADMHRLFDQGYLTVTPDLRVEVSRRLRDDYRNGHSYYPHHGKEITLPVDPACQPRQDFLHWHNDNVYLGS